MSKVTVRDLDVRGKKALVRVDYNVPFEKGSSTVISDDTRIRVSLPTIRHLLGGGAAVILCSHLGRPKGKVQEGMRLAPVARRLSELLGQDVAYVHQCVGPEAEQAAQQLQPGQVLLLENLRFHPGEEKNDPDFARQLASLADIYVNDAFSAAHRAHASTEGVAHLLPSASGFVMERELEALGKVLEHPNHPLAAVIGGAKVSDKIAVLENLAQRVDALFIGGGMAATFLKAQGHPIGGSAIEEGHLGFARQLVQPREAPRVFLPTDLVIAEAFDGSAAHRVVPADQVPDGWLIMDIGPESAERYARELAQCRTIVWNGPMGVFEWEPFAQGTTRVAQALADLKGKATTVVGGGSTAEAVADMDLSDAMTHVSTGGGASLEFLEGKTLPGVAVLPDK